jgi:hypothetical protein
MNITLPNKTENTRLNDKGILNGIPNPLIDNVSETIAAITTAIVHTAIVIIVPYPADAFTVSHKTLYAKVVIYCFDPYKLEIFNKIISNDTPLVQLFSMITEHDSRD